MTSPIDNLFRRIMVCLLGCLLSGIAYAGDAWAWSSCQPFVEDTFVTINGTTGIDIRLVDPLGAGPVVGRQMDSQILSGPGSVAPPSDITDATGTASFVFTADNTAGETIIRFTDNLHPFEFCDVQVFTIASGNVYLSKTIASFPPPRPGFPTEYFVTYFNGKTTPLGSILFGPATIEDVLPSGVTYDLCGSPPMNVSCNTDAMGNQSIIFNIGVVPPMTEGTLTIPVTLDVSLQDGDDLINTVCYPLCTTPESTTELTSTVLASRDPNDKGISPLGYIGTDEPLLFYIINYENLGSIFAQFILIDDELSPLLDDATIEFISDGGTYNPTTRIIHWDLQDIFLEPGETGSVFFLIRPSADLPPGTEIVNNASIVFDFNDPLITPDVRTVIGTSEELACQAQIKYIRKLLDEIETEMTQQILQNTSVYLALMDDAQREAFEALSRMYEFTSPIPPLFQLREILQDTAAQIAAQSGGDIPEEFADKWVHVINNVIISQINEKLPEDPVADAGPDQTIEATAPLMTVTLDGSDSFDPDAAGPQSGIVSYQWFDQTNMLVASGPNPTLNLGLGTHVFTLIVNDGQTDSPVLDEGTEDDSRAVVIIQDTTPPQLNIEEITGNNDGLGAEEYYSNTPIVIHYIAEDSLDDTLDIVANIGTIDPVASTVTIDPFQLEGPVDVSIRATDDSGNTTTKVVNLVIIRLFVDAEMTVKPEVLNSSSNGVITVKLVLPEPYEGSAFVVSGILDGATAYSINTNPNASFTMLKFNRQDITENPMDTHFLLIGEFTYEGQLMRYQGEDSIKKVIH